MPAPPATFGMGRADRLRRLATWVELQRHRAGLTSGRIGLALRRDPDAILDLLQGRADPDPDTLAAIVGLIPGPPRLGPHTLAVVLGRFPYDVGAAVAKGRCPAPLPGAGPLRWDADAVARWIDAQEDLHRDL
jgi:hypothetical protein